MNRLYMKTMHMGVFHRMRFETTSDSRKLLENSAVDVCPERDGAIELNVNHPFVYSVTIRKSGSILFLAKVVNP